MKQIGFDLDNTLVDYSKTCEIYSQINSLPNLNSIKTLRSFLKPNGEETEVWTTAQAWIYGEGLEFAIVSPGAIKFLERLNSSGWTYYIFSHKTEFTPNFTGSVPIRASMKEWLNNSKLNSYFGDLNNTFFFNSINEKILGINNAHLDIYVDDLIKILINPLLKVDKKYLYGDEVNNYPGITTIRDFRDIKID